MPEREFPDGTTVSERASRGMLLRAIVIPAAEDKEAISIADRYIYCPSQHF